MREDRTVYICHKCDKEWYLKELGDSRYSPCGHIPICNMGVFVYSPRGERRRKITHD